MEFGSELAAAGYRYDLDVRMRAVEGENQFKAVGVRHDDVGDHQLRRSVLQLRERLVGVARFDHRVSFALQAAPHGRTHWSVIVDDENDCWSHVSGLQFVEELVQGIAEIVHGVWFVQDSGDAHVPHTSDDIVGEVS